MKQRVSFGQARGDSCPPLRSPLAPPLGAFGQNLKNAARNFFQLPSEERKKYRRSNNQTHNHYNQTQIKNPKTTTTDD